MSVAALVVGLGLVFYILVIDTWWEGRKYAKSLKAGVDKIEIERNRYLAIILEDESKK